MSERTTGPAGSTGLIRLPAVESAEHAARPAFVGPETTTYGELAAHVGAIASRLRSLGVDVGDRVAIWMDKGPRYAEAILSALEAGCAYVPLDGGQPSSRVQTILSDSEPAVLFTDRRRLESLAGTSLPASVQAIVVSDDGQAVAPGSVPVWTWAGFRDGVEPAAMPGLEPDDLAAILYTSGSTGTPKGVKITHRNLHAFIGWAREEMDVGPGDVFAGHASFNFDLSTFDLFTSTSVGAALWIVEDAQMRDVAALVRGIQEYGVTVWYSVPSILNLLAMSGALTRETAARLRYVLFAGEVYPMPQLRVLAAQLPERAALYNLYGPTETNVCTYHRVRPEDLTRNTPVPIGVAVGDARLVVVDEHGRPVEDSEAYGELVVEGDCVTPGYWRREHEPPAENHRRNRHPTGDVVGYEDGLLVYHGRKDRMVKLSGYRVELGEIEAAVLAHPDVTASAVVVESRETDARIALYYTLRPGAPRPSLIEIKRHCARLLPRYMLPQTATCLDELPRNANGKTDYRRLGTGPAGPAEPKPAEPATAVAAH
jgi:amino acid adenylation domain-containing protein